MKIILTILNEANDDFFVLFKDKKQINDFLELKSFLFKKNNLIFVPKNFLNDDENILLACSDKCETQSDWIRLGALVGNALKQKDYEVLIDDLTQNADIDSLKFGLLLSKYSFDNFKSHKEKQNKITFADKTDLQEIKNKVDAIFWTRDMVNYPALVKSPTFFKDSVEKLTDSSSIEVTTYDEAWLKENNFGGIVGVGKGSERKPILMIGEYNKNSKIQISIIGKGVLFDSGGLSLKSPSGMETMKSDMAGAATVWGVIKLVADQKLDIGVKVYTPIVENMPSGKAIRPGDVLTLRNNKTIEVLNTDAEGRLIMADALAYASEAKPTVICDIATLTGSAYVALGMEIGAFFTNNVSISEKFFQSNNDSHEKFHELPLFQGYKKLINSDIADMQNTGGRFGGSITAALLLEEFVDNLDWFHLDIAGPGRSRENSLIYPKGGTAFGLISLFNFIKNFN